MYIVKTNIEQLTVIVTASNEEISLDINMECVYE